MKTISDELFEKFLWDETTPEETMAVLEAIKENPELKEKYISTKRFDAIMEAEEREELPLEKKAAKSEDNLCDIMCERNVLNRMLPNYGDRTLLSDVKEEQVFLRGAEEARENKGVAMYNVGRILEAYGLSVTRHFDLELNDISSALARKEAVIVVLNEETLSGQAGDNLPNHAVCVLSICGGNITLYNPSTGNISDSYTEEVFLSAWATSNCFAVCADYPGKKAYDPRPVNLDSVELGEDLDDLTEALAEHAHDIWARQRIDQGWTYGEKRDDENKKHPDLVPYSDLSEQEKDYDRNTSMQTLKLLKRLGYDITHNSENDCHCPDCGRKITLDMSYCPQCGRFIQLEDFSNIV